MTLEEAILYAHQRMKEFGKRPGEYHLEPVFVTAPAGQESDPFSIYAYNEIYILVNPEKYFGILIIADDSGYSTDNPADCGAPEFTGLIQFSPIAPPDWSFTGGGGIKQGALGGGSVEFLRVVY